jgi:ERCC4-type nuclease
MYIKIDNRENELIELIKNLVLFIPSFKQIKVIIENLPLGDVIIADDLGDKIIIERKTISDLLASIKDGRYEEQSYRLNGLNHHNHNIIYLIEGDVNRYNKFKPDNKVEKLTTYSAMFSLNYFKGFSLFRSFNIDETALIICNIAYKLEKDTNAGKVPYYPNFIQKTNLTTVKYEEEKEKEKDLAEQNLEEIDKNVEVAKQNIVEQNIEGEKEEQTAKDYVSVIKKVKKENITPDNIGEIMLCQIPGISSVTALAIIEKYGSIPELIKQIEADNYCLKEISYTNSKGQTRKINKTSIANIVKFLMKK